MADPDLVISGKGGGGGGGFPDSEIRWGAVSKIKLFRPFGPQFGLKIRGARAPSLHPPLRIAFRVDKKSYTL